MRILTHWIIEALSRDTRLHTARFAKTPDMSLLLSPTPQPSSLLLGVRTGDIVAVSSTKKRTELGNLLAVAPTRGGKGLLAVSQLLTWRHSVVINDIKGDLFTQTAGYRSTLGPVFVIDPTGVGHAFDPLSGAETEDELYALATHLLYQADEGEGAIFTQRAITMLTQMLLAARQEKAHPFPYVRALIRSGFVSQQRLSTASIPTSLHNYLMTNSKKQTSLTGFFSPPGAHLPRDSAPFLPKPLSAP